MSNEIVYEVRGQAAWVQLNRPDCANAQNVAMLRALDEAFSRAMADDEIKVIVLWGAGKHFSAGHDIGTQARDIDKPFEPLATQRYPHAGKPGAEDAYVREADAYLGLCRRWRDMPKPTIAMVHGGCIAGGLMLAWAMDLIVASEDAYFSDPVVRMGIPGVEYFAHPHVMGPRRAKEFLFCGGKMGAAEAQQIGMINRVVPRDQLEAETSALAERISRMPRFGLALTKQAINQAEDRMGLRDSMDATYGLHHLAHAHNALSAEDYIGGQSVESMKKGLEDE